MVAPPPPDSARTGQSNCPPDRRSACYTRAVIRAAARFVWTAIEDLGLAYLWLLFVLVCLIAAILPLVVVTHWLGI